MTLMLGILLIVGIGPALYFALPAIRYVMAGNEFSTARANFNIQGQNSSRELDNVRHKEGFLSENVIRFHLEEDDVNPATGLQMVGGFDVDGNLYGTCSSLNRDD